MLDEIQKSVQTKESELLDLQSKIKNKDSEISEIQTTLQTKDSQILNIQNDLESAQHELVLIKNSVLFGITSKMAHSLDKIAPKSTRRGDAVKMVADAYMTKKKHGSKTLVKSAKAKISKKNLGDASYSKITSIPFCCSS